MKIVDMLDNLRTLSNSNALHPLLREAAKHGCDIATFAHERFNINFELPASSESTLLLSAIRQSTTDVFYNSRQSLPALLTEIVIILDSHPDSKIANSRIQISLNKAREALATSILTKKELEQ